MNIEKNITWEFLKNVKDTLDSYRIRALIDAKQEILSAKVYSEDQYNSIMLKMFDLELQKYSLLNYIRENIELNLDSVSEYSHQNSNNITKTLSLLELLRSENLISIEEIYDINKIEEKIEEKVLKDIIVKYIENPPLIKSIYEPVKVIFDSKICSGCGLCSGICPLNCLTIYNGFGTIDEEKCIRCGLCYYFCPRTYLPYNLLAFSQSINLKSNLSNKIGHYTEVYSARSKLSEIIEVAQDGGVTSTCLYYLFDEKLIDIAMGATMSNTLWRPQPLFIHNKGDILKSAGTKYVNNPTLSLLNQLNGNKNKIAIVGVPCMMQGILKSEIYNFGIPSLDQVEYRIGIFCMESFSYQSFSQICEMLDVQISDVKKTNINKGKFFLYKNSGEELSIPIKEISHLAREDCEVCYDLTSESADISIGSIGSPSGWNTVIIRTKKGEDLFNKLIEKDLVEYKTINDVKPGLPLLEKIAKSKKTKSNKHIANKKSNNLRTPIY
jgi:coenzyme F420 hydrogenase subunit beta